MSVVWNYDTNSILDDTNVENVLLIHIKIKTTVYKLHIHFTSVETNVCLVTKEKLEGFHNSHNILIIIHSNKKTIN